MFVYTQVRSRGIAVLDILIGLGMLVVILSFSAPKLNPSAAKADMQAAVQNLEQSVQLARNAARQLETDVVLHLETDPRAQEHSIKFSIPKRKPNLNAVTPFKDYIFPADIRVDAESTEVRFNYEGELETPVMVHLASNVDGGIDERLVIQ